MSMSGLKPKMTSQAYETLERQMMEMTNPKQLKDQLVSLCREIQGLVRESECMDRILGRQVHALSKAEHIGDNSIVQRLEGLRAELANVTSEEKELTEQVRAAKRSAAKKDQEALRLRAEAGNAIKTDSTSRFPVTLKEVEAFLLQQPNVTQAEVEEGTAFLLQEHKNLQQLIEQYVNAKAEAESEVHGEIADLNKKLTRMSRERMKLSMDIEKQLHRIQILTIKLRSVKRTAQAANKSPQPRKSVVSPPTHVPQAAPGGDHIPTKPKKMAGK